MIEDGKVRRGWHKMRENGTDRFEKEGVTGRRARRLARGVVDGVQEWVLCGGFIVGAIGQVELGKSGLGGW